MISDADISALLVTLRLAVVTTVLLLVAAMPLAWWLARTGARLRPVVASIVALPLVLPPTVLGFYLLVLLAPDGAIGRITTAFGLGTLAFSFTGLVIGSFIYSLPFAVQPLRDAFAAVPQRQLEAAATLRATRLDAFFSVVLPQARRGLFTAAVLAFAHTVGEFGVVLMIGGNIPGHTQVLSIAIYDHVEALEYANAHVLSAGLLLFAFLILLAVHLLDRHPGTPRP